MSNRSSTGAAARATTTLREQEALAPLSQATFAAVPLGGYTTVPFRANGQEYVAKPALAASRVQELAVDRVAGIVGMRGSDVPPVWLMEHTLYDGSTRPYFVSPLVGTHDLEEAPNRAVALAYLSDAQLARITLLEYVVGDWDRHEANYRVDARSGRIWALDFGEALGRSVAQGASFSPQHTARGLLPAVAAVRGVSARSIALPRAALTPFVAHRRAIERALATVTAARDGAQAKAQRRLDYLAQLAAQPGDLTYGDLIALSANG